MKVVWCRKSLSEALGDLSTAEMKVAKISWGSRFWCWIAAECVDHVTYLGKVLAKEFLFFLTGGPHSCSNLARLCYFFFPFHFIPSTTTLCLAFDNQMSVEQLWHTYYWERALLKNLGWPNWYVFCSLFTYAPAQALWWNTSKFFLFLVPLVSEAHQLQLVLPRWSKRTSDFCVFKWISFIRVL